MNRIRLLFALLLAVGLSGCSELVHDTGGGTHGFTVAVNPASPSVRGTATQQFTATTSDGSNPASIWSVNGVAGGAAATGTIDATGLYAAPEFPPTNNSITITATETYDSSKHGSTAITLQNPVPQLSTATPTTLGVGTVTLNLTGLHFAPGAVVYVGTTALTTTRTSSTQLTATGSVSASQVGSVNITVTNPDPGLIPSNILTALITKTGTGVVVDAPNSFGARRI